MAAATWAAGVSPAGAQASPPDAPTGVQAVAGRGKATVSWTAPADNGSPITGYTVTAEVVPTGTPPTGTGTCEATPPATSCVVTGLSNDGSSYTFTVTATNAEGTSASSDPSPAVTPGFAIPAYESVTPLRLFDTRQGPKPAAGTAVEIPITPGVPEDATAVLVNLTGVDADAQGHVAIYPCERPQPDASSLNLQPGLAVANLALVEVPDGTTHLCAFTSTGANIIVDLIGAFSGDLPDGFTPDPGTSLSGAPYVPATPSRVLDTRTLGSPVAANTVLSWPLDSLPSVPPSATAVVLNVTSDQASAPGHVTAFACSQDQPPTSNLNVDPAGPTANLVVVPYTPGDSLCLYAATTTHLIVDFVGSFIDTGEGTLLVSVDHQRLLDTRTGTGGTTGPLGAGQTVVLDLGTDADFADAAILNVTSTESASNGYVTVWDCSDPPPGTSSINPKPGRNVPGLVVAPLGSGANENKVCLFTATPTQLVVDLQGWIVLPAA